MSVPTRTEPEIWNDETTHALAMAERCTRQDYTTPTWVVANLLNQLQRWARDSSCMVARSIMLNAYTMASSYMSRALGTHCAIENGIYVF